MQIQNKDGYYEVVRSQSGANYPFGFDPFLFHHPDHVQLQPSSDIRPFFLLDHNTKTVAAHIYILIDNCIGFSPLRGSFGSVQYTSDLPLASLYFFMKYILQTLKNENITSLELVNYPGCYAPYQSQKLQHALISLGFFVRHSQLNHHLQVSENDFAANTHVSALRRLQKCKKAGFSFRKVEAEKLSEMYSFISEARAGKDIPVSLNLQQIQTLFNRFPNNFFLFAVHDGGSLAAATVAIKINQQILYNFCPASPLTYNAYSPVVMLNYGLYNFCAENQIQVLDLGISARPGQEHYSLMNFKENLGGLVSLKLTFGYNFSS